MTVGLELTVERALEALSQPFEKPEPRAFGEPESDGGMEDEEEQADDHVDLADEPRMVRHMGMLIRFMLLSLLRTIL